MNYSTEVIAMKFLGYIIVGVFSVVPLTHADNWQPLTGADTLQKLVSGATAEIELKPGVTALGTYNADGTAEIKAWNETFQRTWSVKGDDQVCYSDVETNCFSFEQNLDDPAQYRARNVESGIVFTFRVTDAEDRTFARETAPDNEGGFGSPSAAEVAAALSDPNTNMGTMNIQFDYIGYNGNIAGASSASATRMLFQPSLPYKLTDTMNLFIRPAIPVIFSQDVPRQGGGFSSEGVDLGDIGFDASLAKSFPSGIVLLGGLAGTLPTATNDALGLDQWLLGPEAAVALNKPWGVLGVLVSHQWDVAGEDDYDTSITGGQYFYAFNLKDGWQINASPTFSYNHEASSGNETTFPLGVGASKTTFLAGRPYKFGLQYWYYAESPDDFGPDFQLRFTVSPVVKLPW
jgi:hypothetical protein